MIEDFLAQIMVYLGTTGLVAVFIMTLGRLEMSGNIFPIPWVDLFFLMGSGLFFFLAYCFYRLLKIRERNGN